MTTRNQKGFGHMGVLAMIIIVAAVAFGGWWVYDHHKKKTTPTPAPAQTYLTVKEWSVKVPTDDTVKGLSYTIDKTVPSGYGQVAHFTSDDLKAVSTKVVNCIANNVDVARGLANEYVPGDTLAKDKNSYYKAVILQEKNSPEFYKYSKQIGDYYYVTPGYAGASCTEKKSDLAKEESAQAAIKAVLAKMVAE
jgi:hypothetical protein